MGLADFITADHTFDQLADESADDDRTISPDVFSRYCERISAKSSPGAAKVGGVRGISADRILEGATLSADERVRARLGAEDRRWQVERKGHGCNSVHICGSVRTVLLPLTQDARGRC
jgi:hypothetical protein